MQGGKDHVASQRGLDTRAGGFFVTHFADHNNVRIGAEKGAHGRGECQTDFRVNLYLTQSLLGDFHRVFGSPDLAFRGVEVTQDGVQGGGFPGTGGSADKEQSIGFADQLGQQLSVFFAEPQFVQRHRLTVGQNTHHHIFLVSGGGNGGDAQFDLQHAVFLEVDFAVLGFAFF